MTPAPKVKSVVKHTFLEFYEPSGEGSAAVQGRARASSDAGIQSQRFPMCSPQQLASCPPQRLLAGSPRKQPACSPRPPPGCSPHSLAPWPETPLMEAAFEHPDVFSCPNDSQWMLPASAGDVPMMDGWMMEPCYQILEYDQYALPVTPGGGDLLSSPSTSSAEDALAAAAACKPTAGQSQEWRTTIMIRGLPAGLTRDMLVQMLNDEGFAGSFDLVYVPVDFVAGTGLGYAFVDCVFPSSVDAVWAAFDGRTKWPLESDTVGSVTWSDPHQGLASHMERYRNSPVMHPDVPEAWKPALFMHGVQIDFPPPTKRIKAPKVRSKKGAEQKA